MFFNKFEPQITHNKILGAKFVITFKNKLYTNTLTMAN